MSASDSSLIAYEILGLPNFASDEEIINKYRVLASQWFPERHNNCSFAIEQFSLINQAAACLLHPGDLPPFNDSMKLLDMYRLFQTLFFGANDSNSEYDEEDVSFQSDYTADEDGSVEERDEQEAAEIANKLIKEEEDERLKAERKKAKKKRRKERKKQQKTETDNPQKQETSTKQTSTSTEKSKSTVNSNTTESLSTTKSTSKSTTSLKSTSEIKSTSTSKILKEKEKVKGQEKEETFSDVEEDIDPSSAFVAVIAKKQKRLKNMEARLESHHINATHSTGTSTPLLNDIPKEDPTSVVLKSRQLALKANELASNGQYIEAINLFTESIKLDPSDHRFYGNRSFCYDTLHLYEKAFKDAEKSIVLCPSWAKGYYRKGRALLGLKKYAEAEKCFIEVMKLDNDCEDAISELHTVKLLQIMEKGFSKEEAESALARHSSVQESINSLITRRLSKANITQDVFFSDDESETFWSQPPPRMQNLQIQHQPKPAQQKPPTQPQMPPQPPPQIVAAPHTPYDIKMDHNNPENHNSLWIGNVQPVVTEKELTSMFSKFGELISVKVMPEKFCAFVNYKNKNAPGKAMKAYQGKELYGTNLVIRFPKLPGETLPKKKPGAVSEALKSKITDECYFWRTTGCVYGESCKNPHIKEHKGIDKKKWHIN